MSNSTRKLLHTTTIKMRWGDMDALGHLNNTYYFRYMETARLEWLESVNAPLEPEKTGPVIAHIACDFKKELVYPADVVIRSYVTHLGRTSMKMDHEFLLAGDEQTIYATGHVVLVWVDYLNGGSIEIPANIRALC